MDDKENAQGVARLRQELKIWEKAFVTANDGRKPGRDDIKNDATIAAKYKQYDRIRRVPEKKRSADAVTKSYRQPESKVLLERPANSIIATTPKKTPSKQRTIPSHTVTLSPVQEVEPTPAFIRCALGPTPQKDGQVLGIFDMLSAGTPSKPGLVAAQLMASAAAVPDTPSKPAAPQSSTPTLSRTPQSSGRRFFLDAFAGTPLKRKRDGAADDDDDDEADEAPSTAKRRFATPSFLRRSFPLATVEEDAAAPASASYAPLPAPFRKRGLVRSLSSIIQGLRKQETQRMDEEWDILHELEAEEQQAARQDPKEVSTEKPSAAATIAVMDSQAVERPLGPDEAPASDDDDHTSAADGLLTGRKPWKKKGLKRQTRRVIMRPVVHKPGKAGDLSAIEEEESAEQAGTHADQSDGNDDDGETQPAADKCKRAASKGARKVSAQAHANFRKLKIKNKNSKAGGRGRFGRR